MRNRLVMRSALAVAVLSAGCAGLLGTGVARASVSAPAATPKAVLTAASTVSMSGSDVTVVPTPSGNGYWIVTSTGGVYNFGDAGSFGSPVASGLHLNSPIVGAEATATGNGYWLVAADGGIFAYGDAAFWGSAAGSHLNSPIVGIARTATGNGYWLVAADGGIFTYGDAPFWGSAAGSHLNSPIVGIARTATGNGYWLTAADGGIFTYGDAQYLGSTSPSGPDISQIVSLAKANLGKHACDPNSLGGKGFESSCANTPPENWCADFAKWVWEHSAVSDTGTLTTAATSFASYGSKHGTLSMKPAVGDAVVFSNSTHVAIVVAVNANGTMITSIGGNERSPNTAKSSVASDTYAPTARGVASYWSGKKLIGFVAPI